MRMSGHRTRAVFERYNVVSEEDLKDAVRRLEAGAADFGQEMDKVRPSAPKAEKPRRPSTGEATNSS